MEKKWVRCSVMLPIIYPLSLLAPGEMSEVLPEGKPEAAGKWTPEHGPKSEKRPAPLAPKLCIKVPEETTHG